MLDDTPINPSPPSEPVGPPEPELRAALRAHFGDPPEHAVDWTALEARIVDGARLRLAQRARRGSWRQAGERWGRIAIPAGLAAAILLAAALAIAQSADSADDQPAIEAVAAVSASDLLPSDPLSVTDQEAFLAVVLDPAER
jgi:hypothetical protein